MARCWCEPRILHKRRAERAAVLIPQDLIDPGPQQRHSVYAAAHVDGDGWLPLWQRAICNCRTVRRRLTVPLRELSTINGQLRGWCANEKPRISRSSHGTTRSSGSTSSTPNTDSVGSCGSTLFYRAADPTAVHKCDGGHPRRLVRTPDQECLVRRRGTTTQHPPRRCSPLRPQSLVQHRWLRGDAAGGWQERSLRARWLL